MDPRWNHSVDADYRQLQLARQGLEGAVHLAGQKEKANWSKIREWQQKPEEHISAFLSRLFKQAEKGRCASLSKLQLCQQEGKYLGFVLKEG